MSEEKIDNKLVVDSSSDNQRIDNLLISCLKDIPKSRIYKGIRNGEFRVNSKRIKPLSRVRAFDKIRIPPNMISNLNYKKNNNNISKYFADKIINSNKIIYDNKDFLIINKMDGYSVHSGTNIPYGIIDAFNYKYGDDMYLAHRIDKNTSGCLVVAKNKTCMRHLQEIFRTRKVKKTYVAVIHGELKKEVKVESKIKDKDYISNEKEGKEALSVFNPIMSNGQYTWVNVDLFTGRNHQIRVHAQEIGHPIVGDTKYGDFKLNKIFYESFKIKRMLLHSYEITFSYQGFRINARAKIDESFIKTRELIRL